LVWARDLDATTFIVIRAPWRFHSARSWALLNNSSAARL
jgi:uncharacterized membrane protein